MIVSAALAFSASAPGAAALRTLEEMRWQRRVLLLFAPDIATPELARQKAILAGWARQAAERDITVVTVAGDRVAGAAGQAAALRQRFRPAEDGFTAILIGKDGGEKLRSAAPMAPGQLARTIDAMPMRRGGGR